MAPKDLFIVRPTLATGGADRVTITLLRHLDRDRFKPSLILLRQRGELMAEIPSDIRVVDLAARNLLTGVLPLRRLVAEESPAIVMSTSSGTNITVAMAVPRATARVVLSERNGLVRDQPVHKLWPLLAAKRLLYSGADCVTAVSAGVAGDLERRLRLPREQLQVVYNPVVTPEIEELASAPIDEPWFEDDIPVLLAAGRLVNAKGFDVLLDAVTRIREETACRLIVLGEGPLRRQLSAQAESRKIADLVKLPGFVANPYAFMRRCAAFVLTSRFEGLPGVLIQAMACGAPVVASDCPFGPAEIVTDGEDGMLVEPEDPKRLAQVLASLLAQAPRARALGRAARLSAQRFTVEAIMPRYIEALDPER